MKKIYFIILISCYFFSVSEAQISNEKIIDNEIYEGLDFRVFTKAGGRNMNKEVMAKFFLNDGANENASITYNGGFGIWISWNRFHLISDVQFSQYDLSSSVNGEVNVKEYYGSVGAGYSLVSFNSFELTGKAGVTLSSADINYRKGSTSQAGTLDSYLASSPGYYMLQSQAWYGDFSLAAIYHLPVSNGNCNKTLLFGLEVGYQPMVSDVEWTTEDWSLEGPNLLGNSMYANLMIGIGLW